MTDVKPTSLLIRPLGKKNKFELVITFLNDQDWQEVYLKFRNADELLDYLSDALPWMEE